MPTTEFAALGCRVHSGWAAVVALAGSPRSPRVIDRRRIEIADPRIPGSKQPFHAAEPLQFAKAGALLDRCEASTRKLARDAVQEIVRNLRDQHYETVGCGIVLGSGRTLPELKSILASHALIHTAEGEFFRQAMLHASEDSDLPVTGIKERELYDRAAQQLRLSADELQRRATELGKPIGPPWTQDQKFATLVAWLALAKSP